MESNNNNIFSADLSSSSPDLSSSSTSETSPIFWIFLVIILGYLGFNIFTYLSVGLDGVSEILKPLFELFGGTSKQIINVSAEGAKEINTRASGTLNKSLADVQQSELKLPGNVQISGELSQSQRGNQVSFQSPQQQNLNFAMNSPSFTGPTELDFSADFSGSLIQGGGAKGSSGWCLVGQENGYRSCASVDQSDTCMSGQIFPTKDVCINPSLRV
jgi:hypothetical protein